MKAFTALLAFAGTALAQSLTDALGGNNQTSALATLLANQTALVQALNNAQGITILAPSNDALQRFTQQYNQTIQQDPDFVTATLQYHVLNGTYRAAQILNSSVPLFVRTLLESDDFEHVDGTQYVQAQALDGNVTFVSGLLRNSTVVTPNINFTGGVIHIINEVLTIPVNVTQTASAAGLSSLAGALIKADILDDVNDADNVTIFAPTNSAFQNIASALTNISNDDLTKTLQYHVVKNSVLFSTSLRNGSQLETLSGGRLTVHAEGSNFFVNGALITIPNILVENGVVHVIDQVLNPGNATAAPSANATAGSVQFSNVTAGSEAPLTSGVPSATATITPRPTGTASTATPAGASSTSSGVAGNIKANVPALVLAAGALLL